MEYPSTDGIERVPPDLRRTILDDLVRYPSRKEPYWIQVMGIPGAGKTEFVHMLADALDFRKPHVLAATDEYLVEIPAYQAMADRDAAFAEFDPVASALGLEVHKRLIAQKSDVLFERSLAHPAYLEVMYHVKKAGYRLIAVYVRTTLDAAKSRVRVREAETGRHVPESLIDERAVLVEDRWKEMKKLADYMLEVENNGEVGVHDALRSTVSLVRDYVRAMKL